jgi:asparagine synthetase B (glutamine-hydrolysing)
MPTLAGWLTGEQVPIEVIEQTLRTMESMLEPRGGQPARIVQPGVGLVVFADAAYAMQRNDDPPVLDWAPERRTLVYRRPLSGLHPLYYIENWPAQGNLLFASEIKALLTLGAPRHLCFPALDALYRYGFIPAPLTIFKNIFVVPAGSILRWQRTKLVVNASTDYRLNEPVAPADAAEQLHSLLVHAVEGLMPKHDQLVALTGGGTASMLSTMEAAHATQIPFTIASFSPKQSNRQWRIVERLADACRRPSLAISGVDQPEFWQATLAGTEAPCVDSMPLAFHQLLHTVAAEAGARVALTGLGARFLLGKEVQHGQVSVLNQDEVLVWYSHTLLRSDKELSLPWSQEAQQALRTEEPWGLMHHARRLARKATQLQEPWQRWYYLDLHLRLPDLLVGPAQQLATQERMVLRSPYLHADVIDLLTRLPASLPDSTSKIDLLSHILQQFYPLSSAFAAISAPLPLMVPLRSLLQGQESDLLGETLSPEVLRARGLFDVEAVEQLRRQKSVSRELLLVFTTQLFCHLFGVEI